MAVFTFFEQFAELNDDVLFGEVWSREDKLSSKDRSIVTVTTLMASGILDSSLKFHLANAKKHGVTQEEIAEIITHAAFYAPHIFCGVFFLPTLQSHTPVTILSGILYL